MNKIICDNQECKAEIQMTKDLVETKFIKDGIEIKFFRCGKCGTKYLIDVTDRTTREKQEELRKWSEQRKKALDVIVDGMKEEDLKKLTMLADECQFNMDRLQAEIKEAKAELKVKYGDLL